MPEPCEFISKKLPRCAIIRPTGPGQIDARGAINGFIATGSSTANKGISFSSCLGWPLKPTKRGGSDNRRHR